MVYLICFIMRSGSNYLCSMLRQAGLGHPAEYYFPFEFEKRVRKAAFGGNTRFDPRAATPREYFQRVVDSQPGPVAGIKCGWHSLQVIREELGGELDALDLRYVYLTRRDRLRQAISWYRARQTGRWTAFDPPGRGEPPYDREAIRKHIEFIETSERRWEGYFEGKQVLRLQYEDLGVASVRRIAEFLGLDVPGACDTDFPIQRDATTEEWVRRYEAG